MDMGHHVQLNLISFQSRVYHLLLYKPVLTKIMFNHNNSCHEYNETYIHLLLVHILR